jgi:hypothetical protein
MTESLGWSLIVLTLCVFSLMALGVFSKLVRRVRGKTVGGLWSYAAATVGLSLILWFAIPPIVHGLFGRTVH